MPTPKKKRAASSESSGPRAEVFSIDNLPADGLFPPRSPHEPGWTTISEAAFWIATRGGTASFNMLQANFWREAFDALMPRITTNEIAVVGNRRGQNAVIAIEGINFVGVSIDYPYADGQELLPKGNCLTCVGVGEKDPSLSTDSLYIDDVAVAEFSNLNLRNADVAKWFPFKSEKKSPGATFLSKDTRIRSIYVEAWPSGCTLSAKERDAEIQRRFGPHPPSSRTIQRALSKL